MGKKRQKTKGLWTLLLEAGLARVLKMLRRRDDKGTDTTCEGKFGFRERKCTQKLLFVAKERRVIYARNFGVIEVNFS